MARRLQLSVENEDAYEAASEELLAGFEASADGPKDRDAFAARMMLEYQWSYEDGRLAHWTVDRVDQLLLRYLPRKVSLEPGDIKLVPRQVAAFLRYLDAIGVLTGDPLPRLVAHTERMEGEFWAAMHDPSRFGMQKQMVSSMAAEGVDPSDPAVLDAWMQDFNARPLAERGAILAVVPDDHADGDEDDPFWDDDPDAPMPLVRLGSAAELDEAARRSVTLTRLTAFARYVDKPRKLTGAGNLTLADGKALTTLLGIESQWNPTYGSDRLVFRTTSSGNVPGLARTFQWARVAGFVKVRTGSVSCTARGRRLGVSPTDDWSIAYRALLDGKVEVRERRSWWWEDELVSEFGPELAPALYRSGDIRVDSLHDAAVRWLEEVFVLPDASSPFDVRRFVPGTVDRRMVAPLVDIGAADITDGVLALTPLGLWGTNGWLRSRGIEAPVTEDLPKLDAGAFLEVCAGMDLEDAEAEMRRWIAGRPETAATELAAVARTGDLRSLAMHALEFAGDAGVGAVRGLLDVPDARPMATLWLVRLGHLGASSLSTEDLQSVFIETVALDLDHAGAEEMAAHLDGLGPRDEQLRFLEGLVRAPHPRTTDVLLAIGRAHPEKAVAKTARTVAFKRQGIRPH